LLPFGLACRAADPISESVYRLWRGKRETVRRNFAWVLDRDVGDPLVDGVTAGCFRHFGRYIAEMLHVQGWDTQTLIDRVTVEGEEHFAEAEAHGRGIIFVSAHMGSAEAAAGVAVLRGYRVTAVTEQLRPRFLMDWAIACRARMGVNLLPVTGLGSGISLLRALRRKELVAFVVDAGVEPGRGAPVSFFGRPAVFPDGPARIARLSGAPIVFAVAVRRSDGKFVAHIEPPMVSDRECDAEEDAVRLTQRLASAFGRYVRRYPSQWYAFRDIW